MLKELPVAEEGGHAAAVAQLERLDRAQPLGFRAV